MIMEQLPNIPPGKDFDRQVLYRAWMASMPRVETPAGFDAAVLKTARKGAMSHWWGIAVIAVFLAAVGGLTLVQDHGSVVTVSRVPLGPKPMVDLTNLPPVPVVEDVRFSEPDKPVARRAAKPAPFGVAGH